MSLLTQIGQSALEGATSAAKEQVKIWLKDTFDKNIRDSSPPPASNKAANSPDTSSSNTTSSSSKVVSELKNINVTMESVVKNVDQTNSYLWTSIGKQTQTNLLLSKIIEKIESNKNNDLFRSLANSSSGSLGGKGSFGQKLGKLTPGMKVGGALAVLGATQSAINEFGESGDLTKSAAVGGGNFVGGMGGAWAGAKLGAAGGSFGGPIGTAVGGVGGALVGGYLGSKAGETLTKKMLTPTIKPSETVKEASAISIKKSDSDNMTLNLKSFTINAAEIKINGNIMGAAGGMMGALKSGSSILSNTMSGGDSNFPNSGNGGVFPNSSPSNDTSSTNGNSRNPSAGYQRRPNSSAPNNYPVKPGSGNKNSDELGSLSAKYEGKVDSANRDNVGWAYGKYQFNSATGGLDLFFKDNPNYAKQFEGLTPGTPQFNSKWREIAATDKENFSKAQTKSAANLWYNPAIKHAEKLGFNVQNRGIQEAVFSGSINHGSGGISSILSNASRTNDLSKLTPEQQISSIYSARKNYVSSSSKIDDRTKASLLKRYESEEKEAISYAANKDKSESSSDVPTNSRVIEAQGKLAETRTMPLNSKVKDILNYAANKNGVYAEVFSGGQPGINEGGRRKGSTRHDHGNAADTKFYTLDENGKKKYLDMDTDREKMSSIVRDAASAGATGIGGAANYMGTKSLHIGLGSRATWGRKGEGAPAWLSQAAAEGWDRRIDLNDWKKRNSDQRVSQRNPLEENPPVNQRSLYNFIGISPAQASPVRTEASPLVTSTTKQNEDNAIDFATKLNSQNTKGTEVLARSDKDSINSSVKSSEPAVETVKETVKETKTSQDINQKEPSKASPSAEEVKKLMEEWS